MAASREEIDERFARDDLDLDLWFPYYLPHWSSRAESAATWSVVDDGLRLSISADQPRWCPDLHDEPLRVSCIQSGSFAGPVGSTIGQQPFRGGLRVREAQPTLWGYTPLYGLIEVRMRGTVAEGSMFAFWMSGIEDRPERCGEICVAEVFGASIRDGSVEVGMGVKKLGDPRLVEAFGVEHLEIDVSEFHTYGVEWRPGSLTFTVDDARVRRIDHAPDYPMQLMLGVFDFPDRARGDDAMAVAELVVSHVRGRPM